MNFDELHSKVLQTIYKMIQGARGTCITFKCITLARRAGLDTKPTTLSLIRVIIDELISQGNCKVLKKDSHGFRFVITNNMPIWHYAKNQNITS